MAQTSVDFIEKQIDLEIEKFIKDSKYGVGWSIAMVFKSLRKIQQKAEQAKEMHKVDCINFSIEWENRRDDEDIKSKEDLYDLIYKK